MIARWHSASMRRRASPSSRRPSIAPPTRLRALGHRVAVDPSAPVALQRFAASDDERLAAIHAHGGRSPASTSPSRCAAATAGRACVDRIDFAALAARGKRWMGHCDFTAFQLAALARAGHGRRSPGPMVCYDFGRRAAVGLHVRPLLRRARQRSRGKSSARSTGPASSSRRARCGAATSRWSRISSARATCPMSPAASCFSRTSANTRTGSSACSTSCTTPACWRGSARCCSAHSPNISCNDNDGGYDLAAAVAHLRKRTQVPIFTGLPFGHVPDKLTLPVGGRCDARGARRDGEARALRLSAVTAAASFDGAARRLDGRRRASSARCATPCSSSSRTCRKSSNGTTCDARSMHALAVDREGAPIGCGRLLPDGHIGRLAVVGTWRGRGVGAALLQARRARRASAGTRARCSMRRRRRCRSTRASDSRSPATNSRRRASRTW